jgi:hypothetical protein
MAKITVDDKAKTLDELEAAITLSAPLCLLSPPKSGVESLLGVFLDALVRICEQTTMD